MKVLLLNGSPNPAGCTFTALSEVAGQLNKNGIETETVQLGNKPVRGCIGCASCRKSNNGCVFKEDLVNEMLDKMKEADGLVIGSPVYFASPNGSLIAFLDRLFYSGAAGFAFKPGAIVTSARRAGTTATLDVLHKYLDFANMPIVTSKYWNMVHGKTPDEVRQDLEGMQTMRMLGNNMAWLLKCIEAGKKAGFSLPEKENPVQTSFIR